MTFSFKNTLIVGLVAGSSLLTSGVTQAQTTTRQELCELIIKGAHNGWTFMPDHIAGFKVFFDDISLTAEEKKAIDDKLCQLTEYLYYNKDKVVSDIMRDNTLTNQQKKSLIFKFLFSTIKNPWPIDPSLEQYYKKYLEKFKEYMIWTMDPANKDKMIAYSKERLAKSKEDLAKSKEDLAKAKKTDELFQQIQKLEELVQMLESE